MRSIRNVLCTASAALLFAAGVLFVATPSAVGAEVEKPAVAGNDVPKGKQTALGLYVTAAKAYEMWKAAPDKVKVIDVRTPEVSSTKIRHALVAGDYDAIAADIDPRVFSYVLGNERMMKRYRLRLATKVQQAAA